MQEKPVKENLSKNEYYSDVLLNQSSIIIYDAIMSSGKTTDAISRMHHYVAKEQKFIYVTPFLEEIKRVSTALGADNIESPAPKWIVDDNKSCFDDDGNFDIEQLIKKKYARINKSKDFIRLVKQGKNIATTHALYTSLSVLDAELFKDYILIIDEAVSPVTAYKIGVRDVEIMHNENLIETCDKTSKVTYTDEFYKDDCFGSVLDFCKQDNVYLQHTAFVSVFPIELFTAFKEVQVLTYKFESSIMSAYFKMHDLHYTIQYNSKEKIMKEAFKKNLTIYEGEKNQHWSIKASYLCKSGIKNMTTIQRKKLVDDTMYVFRYEFKTNSDVNAYTTFKDYETPLGGKTYKRGFIAINARATNDYAHIQSMAYLGNRYLTPEIKNFFINQGTPIDEEQWALSELIQWIWRGCIRNNQPMNLYIPSTRMRTLLLDWLVN